MKAPTVLRLTPKGDVIRSTVIDSSDQLRPHPQTNGPDGSMTKIVYQIEYIRFSSPSPISNTSSDLNENFINSASVSSLNVFLSSSSKPHDRILSVKSSSI